MKSRVWATSDTDLCLTDDTSCLCQLGCMYHNGAALALSLKSESEPTNIGSDFKSFAALNFIRFLFSSSSQHHVHAL